jgi:MEDS: MEthanogen/methylotroph, DcmR Sensory domain
MKEAQHQGWSRVRFCGNGVQPLPDSGWMERVRYEQIPHELVATNDVAVLCAYRMGTFLPVTAKNELLQTHHAALVTEHDTWEYIPTSK